jgi:hypothetical protein
MSDFTQEHIHSVAQLLTAGGDNIEIAKQLYINFISKHPEREREFWATYHQNTFGSDFNREDFYSDEELITNYIGDNLCLKFGFYGIRGLELFLETNYCEKPEYLRYLNHVTDLPIEQVDWSIVGMNKWHRVSGQSGYGFRNVTDYEFIIKGKLKEPKNYVWQKYISVRFQPRHGSCGSGWCSASFGDCVVTEIGYNQSKDCHFLPIKHIPVELVCFGESNYLLDEEGSLIWSSGTGGDVYYPRGAVFHRENLNTLFISPKTERLLDKPNVYFFSGESGVGKSYIGSLLNRQDLSVFETDALDMDEEGEEADYVDLDYMYGILVADIVVVGNKHPTLTLDKVLQTYQHLAQLEGVTTNIIICNFKPNIINNETN